MEPESCAALDDGERQAGNNSIQSFPQSINVFSTTFDALADAVAMCIHIASHQHTAVNDLQQYYQFRYQ
jgi:hypothetical protein